MDLVTELAIVLCLSGLLSGLAYSLHLLTPSGTAAAFLVGVVIGGCGSIEWLVLLIAFTIIGFSATLFGLSKKESKGIQEGNHGERTHLNVLGVGIPVCIFAILNLIFGNQYYPIMTIGYLSAIAVAAADTAASEIGIKDQKVWLITNLKRVEPGVNGGISVLGTAVALVAAAGTSMLGWIIVFQSINILILIPVAAGILGCMADSVLGATLENNGYITKYGNNCITEIMGGIFAVLVCLFIISIFP